MLIKLVYKDRNVYPDLTDGVVPDNSVMVPSHEQTGTSGYRAHTNGDEIVDNRHRS